MTEEQWNSCTDPDAMLRFLLGRASERKLRLFAVACCRRAGQLMTEPSHRKAVDAAELLADGLLTEAEFEELLRPIVALWAELPDGTRIEWEPSHYMIGAARHLGTAGGASYAASYVARGLACLAATEGSPEWLAARQVERAAQCRLIRDLFGNYERES